MVKLEWGRGRDVGEVRVVLDGAQKRRQSISFVGEEEEEEEAEKEEEEAERKEEKV